MLGIGNFVALTLWSDRDTLALHSCPGVPLAVFVIRVTLSRQTLAEGLSFHIKEQEDNWLNPKSNIEPSEKAAAPLPPPFLYLPVPFGFSVKADAAIFTTPPEFLSPSSYIQLARTPLPQGVHQLPWR